jgi:archaetidylinositol phosphate synthase
VRALLTALFTPLGRKLSWVSPNALTVLSLVAGVAAGTAFVLARRGASWYALAAVLLAVSGAADSLDGIVARLHGRATAWGDFLDHFCDRLVEIAVFSGVAFSPHASRTLGLAVLAVTLLHSYLGTQIAASFGARRRGGPGKEELFVALIAYAAVLACLPELSLPLAKRAVPLPNAFLVALAVATLGGIAHRLVVAYRCAGVARPSE